MMLAIITFLSTILLGTTVNNDTYQQTIVDRYVRADNTAALIDTEQNLTYQSGWQFEDGIGWVYLGDEIVVNCKDA